MELDGLVNAAVPSPVAYPAGYCVVEASRGSGHVETVSLAHAPGLAVYADEIRRGHLNGSGTYADVLPAHLRHRVKSPDMALLPLRDVLEDYYLLRACGGAVPGAVDHRRAEFYCSLY